MNPVHSFLRRVPVLLFLVVFLGIVPAANAQASAPPSSSACNGPGKARWPIKTSLPANTDLNSAKQVALNDLLALPEAPGVKNNDARYQDARIPSFNNSLGAKEGDLLTTTGWLYLVATESDDCDYHIQISPQARTTTNKPTADDNCLIIEAPRPDFVDDPQLKQAVTTLRDYIRTKLLRNAEPINAGNVMVHAVCVRVTGQLFYDDAHLNKNGSIQLRGKRGMSSHTLWELHPLSNFQIVPPTSCPQ